MDERDAGVERAERRPVERTAEPEAGGRLLLGWILIVIGAVMVFGGWIGVSANPQVAVQLSYLVSGGVGGLFAGIVGVGLLVSDDIRKDRARLGRMEAAVLDMREFAAAQAEVLGLAGSESTITEGGPEDETTAKPSDAAGHEPATNGRLRAGARRR